MKSSEKLLTFEVAGEQTIEVHANPEGLGLLIELLQGLQQHGGQEHLHLQTPAWAGAELTEEAQGAGVLVHQVTVYLWGEGETVKKTSVPPRRE